MMGSDRRQVECCGYRRRRAAVMAGGERRRRYLELRRRYWDDFLPGEANLPGGPRKTAWTPRQRLDNTALNNFLFKTTAEESHEESGEGLRREYLKPSPVPESLVLHVDQLSRNVNENHLKEIFGNFGEVVNVRLAIDHVVNIPKGFAYVEFKNRVDADKAQLYMDGAQVDGKVVRAKFTLPERKRAPSPPKAVSTTSRRDAPKSKDAAADVDKVGPKKPREASPRGRPLSPPRRRSPGARRGSPRRGPGSPPPRRRVDSPVRRKAGSPYRRGDSPPLRRRPGSPPRGRSPSSPPRRYRSPPRGSPRRMRGSPIRRRSPLPLRRRLRPEGSPRRARSPPRRSPAGRRRSRSPIRRPARSPSGSPSPRRGRGPPARRGRLSSYSSSPSPRRGPRRVSRSRSPRSVFGISRWPIRGRGPSSSSSSTSTSSSPPHTLPLPPPPPLPRKP
ncbi:hypothetical protein OROGR_001310 [Orobanche gracilis]